MKTRKVLLVVLIALMASALWAGGTRENVPSPGGALPIQMVCRLYEQPPDMDNFYWRTFQERANVKLDVTWIPSADFTTRLNLILSSGDLPEVLGADYRNNAGFIRAVQQGAFWDLTPILGDFSDYPNLRDNSAPDSWKTSRVLGRNYGIPRTTSQWQGAPLVRKDLFDEAGLPMPTTMTEFLDGLEAIRRRHPDMLGMALKDNLLISDGGFLGGFGGNDPYFNDEGGLVWSRLTPAYTKYLAFMREAYARGLMSREYAVMQPTQAVDYFQGGMAIAFIHESARWCYPFQVSIREKTGNQNAEVMYVPPLVGDPGMYVGSISLGWNDSFYISSRVPREKVLQILGYFDSTATPEFYELSTYGVEGVHWTRDANGNRVTNAQRDRDLGQTNPWQVLPGYYYAYQKIDSTAAPESYNERMRNIFDEQMFATRNKINPFQIINSARWAQAWPRFESNWLSQAAQFVSGQITLEQYQAYVDTINRDPDMRAGYREFAEQYREIFF